VQFLGQWPPCIYGTDDSDDNNGLMMMSGNFDTENSDDINGLNVLILIMYEINTLLLLLLKMYLIISKHRKSLILLKKLVLMFLY